MQPQDTTSASEEVTSCVTSNSTPISDEWANYRDDDVMQQHSAIRAEQADKMPFVGDKDPLSALAAEYQSGSIVLQEKIKILGEQYAAIRRTRGDGNCFFRGFMFSYLEHILESQDKAEVDRMTTNVEQCKKTLQSLGYADFTFEDFFACQHFSIALKLDTQGISQQPELFIEQLECVVEGNENSISHDELLKRSRDQFISDYIVMFFRFVTSGEIRRRSEFFEPFVLGLTNGSVDLFCKTSVEPMGEESDHVHIIALSDALGVPIRVVYLDRSSCDTAGVSVNHHDFIPSINDPQIATKPIITLLYRPGHYDILYPK